MVQDNTPANRAVGQPEHIHDGDLSEVTVDSDRWVPIFEKQSSKSIKFFPGYGHANRQGQAGFADFDLEADGTGTGSDGDAIQGQYRWEIYNDAEQDDLAAVGPYFRAQDLRNAVSENRTESVLAPMQAVGAPEDGYLVLAFKADSGSDGAVIEADDAAHSGTLASQGIPYSRVQA